MTRLVPAKTCTCDQLVPKPRAERPQSEALVLVVATCPYVLDYNGWDIDYLLNDVGMSNPEVAEMLLPVTDDGVFYWEGHVRYDFGGMDYGIEPLMEFEGHHEILSPQAWELWTLGDYEWKHDIRDYLKSPNKICPVHEPK